MRNAKIMQEGAEVLQQIDVSDIFTSLALGIAEAQERLDDNSIKQILRLSEQEVAGKSLIELGFVPAFYHFDYADISASIQLKMAVKTSTDFAVQARIEYAKSRGYDESFLELLNEAKREKKRTEFKSSRTFLINSNSSERIEYQNKTLQMNQSSGSIEKVEMMKEEMRSAESIERVEVDVIGNEEIRNTSQSSGVVVSKRGGYGMIYIPNRSTKAAILKVRQYPSSEQSYIIGEPSAGDVEFKIKTSFQSTLDALNAMVSEDELGSNVYVRGFQRKTADDAVGNFSVYYANDKDRVNDAYAENGKTNAGVFKQINALADVLLKDSSLTVRVIGFTDSKGKSEYNLGLGKRRAERLKDHLVARGVQEAQVITSSKGQGPAKNANGNNTSDVAFRRVDVRLPETADYFFIQGSNIKSNISGQLEPQFEESSNYGFIAFLPTENQDQEVSFEYGEESFDAEVNSAEDFSQKTTQIQGFDDTFSSEVNNEVVHLLSHSSTLQFTSYSNESEDISINSSTSEVGTESGTEDTLLVDESVNSMSRLRNDAGATEEESTFAVGASVDFRTSRQFEMSVTGNASMSARLSSVPAPDAFSQHLMNVIKGNN